MAKQNILEKKKIYDLLKKLHFCNLLQNSISSSALEPKLPFIHSTYKTMLTDFISIYNTICSLSETQYIL